VDPDRARGSACRSRRGPERLGALRQLVGHEARDQRDRHPGPQRAARRPRPRAPWPSACSCPDTTTSNRRGSAANAVTALGRRA
jgi:hypothetical protein